MVSFLVGGDAGAVVGLGIVPQLGGIRAQSVPDWCGGMGGLLVELVGAYPQLSGVLVGSCNVAAGGDAGLQLRAIGNAVALTEGAVWLVAAE